jgi:hypothetical protein
MRKLVTHSLFFQRGGEIAVTFDPLHDQRRKWGLTFQRK